MPSSNKKKRDYSEQYAKYGRMMNSDVALYGMFLCVAMLVSYLESLIPITLPIPGVKLGLANIVIVWILYCLDWKAAAMISLIRVALMGILFGNLYSILFSLVGAALSLLVMTLLKKSGKFKILGVSIAGGVCHNVGQILVAMAVLENARLISYLPVLLASGVIAGIAVGILSGILYSKLRLNPEGSVKSPSGKSEKIAANQAEDQAEDKAESKTEGKTEDKAEGKTEDKAEGKTEDKAEGKTEDKAED